MTLPDASRLQQAVEVTWPPLRMWHAGPFTCRDGAGGGKRVSATSADGHVGPGDIAAANAEMADRGMTPLYWVRTGEEAFDAALADAGLEIIDPVTLYAAPLSRLVDPDLPRLAAIGCEAPLAILREIWAEGGIGPGRLQVMARAPGPSRYILGRAGDRPAGAGFVSVDGDMAMIHGIEVRQRHRRQGVGRAIIARAAAWAAGQGCTWLGLAVTTANGPARALYTAMGMVEAGTYHYRILARESRA